MRSGKGNGRPQGRAGPAATSNIPSDEKGTPSSPSIPRRTDDPADPEPVDLFEFLRLVVVADAHGKLTRRQAQVAIMTALDSEGTTGTKVVVDAGRTATELGIGKRQVWDHFRALREGGWFGQTTAPTRGANGKSGRRARYRCLSPLLDLGLTDDSRVQESRDEPAHDSADSRVQGPTVEPAHDNEKRTESCAGFDANRVRVSAESCAGAERENRQRPTSDGPTSDGTTPEVELRTKPQDARDQARNNESGPAAVRAAHRAALAASNKRKAEQ